MRLTMHHDAATLTVTIHADRPETLALLRRHADVLAQELRDQGYAQTSFNFSGGQGGQDHPHPGSAPSAAAQAVPGGGPASEPGAEIVTLASRAQEPQRPADGLDLRL